MNNQKMRFCSFCHSSQVEPVGLADVWGVLCNNCFSVGPEATSAEEAIEKWNAGTYDLTDNLLRGTKAYMIGHMEFINGQGWRNRVKQELGPRGITLFDPYVKPFIDDVDEDDAVRAQLKVWMNEGGYDKVTERMKPVRGFDLRLCDLSDFIIAHITPEVASWGTAEEFVTSVRMKKPIFLSVAGGKKKTPLWIMGMIPHKYIYDSIEESINMIKKIDAGLVKIDSDRWKLLKPEYR